MSGKRKVRLVSTKTDYGGGSGREVYCSKLFRVTVWYSRGGVNTSLSFGGLFDGLTFDGNQKEYLTTDCKCISALRPSDIAKLIKSARSDGFADGRAAVQSEIRKALG